jgi:uridine kinase
MIGPSGIGSTQTKETSYAINKEQNPQLKVVPILLPGYQHNQGQAADAFDGYIRSIYSYHDWTQGITQSLLLKLVSKIKGNVDTGNITNNQQHEPTKKVLTFVGGSGAGMKQVCENLKHLLIKGNYVPNRKIHITSMSNFYLSDENTRKVQYTHRFGSANFDRPELVNFEKLCEFISDLKSGVIAQEPVYDKKKHLVVDFKPIVPPEILLLEGIFLFHWEQIHELSDFKYFIDVEDDIRLSRRIQSDLKYGLSVNEILDYYFDSVKPGYKNWVSRYKDDADKQIRVEATKHTDVHFKGAAREVLRHFCRIE